jgi:hypothetical protein
LNVVRVGVGVLNVAVGETYREVQKYALPASCQNKEKKTVRAKMNGIQVQDKVRSDQIKIREEQGQKIR